MKEKNSRDSDRSRESNERSGKEFLPPLDSCLQQLRIRYLEKSKVISV